MIFLSACGAGGANTSTNLAANQSQTKVDPSFINERGALGAAEWTEFLSSVSYADGIIVAFTTSSQISFNAGNWRSASNESVEFLKNLQNAFPEVVPARVQNLLSEEEFESKRQEKVAEGFADFPDFNRWYVFPTSDADVAKTILSVLLSSDQVKFAHPDMKLYPASIPSTPSSIPNLFPRQDYLDSPVNVAGGLNVTAAWEQGLSGVGSTLIDVELNWNFEHADLNVSIENSPMLLEKNNGVYQIFHPDHINDQEAIQHGTAVLGIIAAQDNGAGITGIAPNTLVRTLPMYPTLGATLSSLTVYAEMNAKVKPGTIILFELQAPGISGKPCWEQDALGAWVPTGCLPLEAYNAGFDGLKALSYKGATVIEGAGNGNVDLDDSNNQACLSCPDLSKLSTGAIMVGASNGSKMEREPSSNCGKRVDLFAWGKNVVTAGYGDHPVSKSNNVNEWYTSQFGGTSSASAMIAGIASLLQEHARNLYGSNLDPNQFVYLSNAAVKQALSASGVAQFDSGCAIGKQPDVEIALSLITDGIVQPTIDTYVGASPCVNGNDQHPSCLAYCLENYNAKSCAPLLRIAARMDLDGDSKADLVSFSRQGVWNIDYSSNNFGTVDRTLDVKSVTNLVGRVFPVLGDYNGDSKEDLALYNSDTGILNIKYSGSDLTGNVFGNWDKTINYSYVAGWQKGSRPFPYNYTKDFSVHGPDASGKKWIARTSDIALITANGKWLVDFFGNAGSASGNFDANLQTLSSQHLSNAPGWAYSPVPSNGASFEIDINFKTPDAISGGERFCKGKTVSKLVSSPSPAAEFYEQDTAIGGNGNYFVAGTYQNKAGNVGVYSPGEDWDDLYFNDNEQLFYFFPVPAGTFGDHLCRPVAADFDGDGQDDRATLCPGGKWNIAYSSNKTVAHFNLGGASQMLPGQGYHAGGISYGDVKSIFSQFNFGCSAGKSCSIFDLPAPIGPYFAECMTSWSLTPIQCLNY